MDCALALVDIDRIFLHQQRVMKQLAWHCLVFLPGAGSSGFVKFIDTVLGLSLQLRIQLTILQLNS